MKKAIQKICFSVALFLGIFVLAGFAFATCPSMTTVSGTNVTFVGELTDTGGAESTYVWFEYGKTTSYGYKTSEKAMSSAGLYCIDVSDLSRCTTYHYRAVARNSAGTSYGENKTFTTSCQGASVDIRADGSNGPITIPYDSAVTLTWNAENVDSCTASGAWSGNKVLSGSQSTGNLTSSKTYTITCTGPGGSASDSVTVNVGSQVAGEFTIRKTIRNLTRGTVFSDSVYAEPGEALVIGIVVQATNDLSFDVVVKDTLPAGLVYRGELMVDNVLNWGNILTGLNIGALRARQQKTITFRADVAAAGNFAFGQTELTNTAVATSGNTSRSDDAKVLVTRTAVAGTATQIPTGLTNNFFFDSFFLPLLVTLLIIWLLKSRILKLEEWLDARKKQYQAYKSNKILQLRIAQAKAKEFLRQRM